MFAAVAALFATSCVTDTTSDVAVTGGECDVTLSVVAPGADSRTIGDGLKALKLTCGVYDADWNYLTSVDGNFDGASTTTTLSMRLVKGKKYNFVFWAQNPNAPYTLDLGTVGVASEPIITVDYTDVTTNESNVTANEDNLDAFFGRLENYTVNGTVNETIYLKRPFAQINFGTSDEEAAKEFGFNVIDASADAKVTVSTMAYTTLSLRYGRVSGEQPVTFLAAAPATQTTSERLSVNNNSANYYWLAMNYILVPEEESSLAKCDLTVEIPGQVPVEVSVPMAPAKRNWRTNLVGQLLTEQGNFTIEILPIPEGDLPNPDDNNLVHELILTAAVGGEITLTEDVVLTQTLNVTADMTINLNGKTISGNWHKDNGAIIKNNGTLTIVGGTISSLGENGGSAIQNSGTMVVIDATLNGAVNANGSWPSYAVNNTGNLTLNNVVITSYHGAVASYGNDAVVTLNDSTIDMQGIPGFTNHGIYTYNSGKVVVNGGNYANKATDQSASGASVINGAVTVNSGNFSGRIENYYGTPVLKGGSYSVKPNNNFLAAGYKAVENAEKTLWVVAPAVAELENAVVHEESGLIYNGNDAFNKSVYYILNAGDLKKAVDYFVNKTHEGNVVAFELMADIDMSGIAWEPWNIMWINFKGNNHTISNLTTVEGWRGGLFGYFGAGKVENLTIENATVVGAQAGILVGATEAVVATNVKIAGVNSVTYKPYVSASYTETWGGIGAVSGVNAESTLDVEIVAGAVVDVNTNGMVTEAPFVDALTGHLQPNKGRVVVNGTVNYNVDSKIVANSTGTTYYGDHFYGQDSMSDALVINGANLTGDATIEVKRKYNAIVIENVKGDLNGDFITIDNEDNSVMILQNCDLTLAEGKKFIKSTKTIYQVFMANITINGVKLTNANAAQYLENVGWFQVVEEI